MTEPFEVQVPERQRAPQNAGTPAKLRVSDLNFYYGSNHVLHDVGLEIPPNRVTALIGPSGCGKSTFLRSLNRMYQTVREARVSGTILLDREDVLSMDVSVLRRRVGMVFQKSNPFPKSIFDNVAYGPRVNGYSGKSVLRDIVERSLRRAALWDEVKDQLHKSAYALSGGQQQRLLLARALYQQPSILILDEATSHLDVPTEQRIAAMLSELRITRVFAAHRPDTVAIAGRVLALTPEGLTEVTQKIPGPGGPANRQHGGAVERGDTYVRAQGD